MRRRAGILGVLVSAVLGVPVVSAQTAPPANDDCLGCHAEPSLVRSDGRPVAVKAEAFAASVHASFSCVDCHSDLAKAELPHAERLAPVGCATCHDEPAGLYTDSIHGQARTRTSVAPTCTSCHGSHDIRPKADAASPVHGPNIPTTCSACHADQHRLYGGSIHAEQLEVGNTGAPQCVSCHTAHRPAATASDAWQLSAVEQCGTCHREALATYRDSVHGQVTALGFTPVAKCADCHQPHQVLAVSNPASSVAPGNRLATCRTCHPSASENFALFQPHANKDDRERLPALYYAARFMDALLIGVFGFFGAHTVLWFARERVGRDEGKEEDRRG